MLHNTQNPAEAVPYSQPFIRCTYSQRYYQYIISAPYYHHTVSGPPPPLLQAYRRHVYANVYPHDISKGSIVVFINDAIDIKLLDVDRDII
jgi:hypothetical protein